MTRRTIVDYSRPMPAGFTLSGPYAPAPTVADLRRQARAARTLYRAERMAARVEDARAILEPLAGAEPVTVPGYRLTRDATGALHVAPVEPIDAAQLALWRMLDA